MCNKAKYYKARYAYNLDSANQMYLERIKSWVKLVNWLRMSLSFFTGANLAGSTEPWSQLS